MNQFVKAELILIDTELNLEPTLCKFCDKSFPVFYSSLYSFLVEVLFLSLSDIYLLFILHFIYYLYPIR